MARDRRSKGASHNASLYQIANEMARVKAEGATSKYEKVQGHQHSWNHKIWGCRQVDEISWDEAIELASPYPYVLAVTLDRKGKPNIIGLGWWTITSWQPRMIAISIGHPRYSHECLEHCGEFVLCFPSEEQARGAWFCGNASGRNVDKFAETGFKQAPSKAVKPPIIDGSSVAFECRVVNKMETGDHTLYVGEVVAVHGSPSRPKHLYSIEYRRLISIDTKGNANFRLEYD